MIEDYYNAELAYLRDLAQEFAEAHPEVAHMVSERGGDRSVERTLQGAALLMARLRFRLDDDFPEIIHALFDSLWPQYLRPLPAVSLLQFVPLPNVLRQSQTIARATSVRSRPVEGVECNFLTTAEVELHPFKIVEAGLSRPHPADLQLRLRFDMTGGIPFDTVRLRSLRIHLLGSRFVRFTLFLWLVHWVQRVSVGRPEQQPCLVLPAEAVRPVGMGASGPLYPFSPTLLPGLRLLQEYFSFSDKFLALELTGLEKVPEGSVESSFTLTFHLGTPPEANLRVDKDNFALGCTPVINLTQGEQVDVPVVPGATEYRLQAPHGGEVFSVERVGAYDARTGEWTDYPPLYSQDRSHEKDHRLRYQIIYRSDGLEGVETYLAIRDGTGTPRQPPTELLNVHMTYTNGSRVLRLGVGEIDVPTSSSPQFVQFSNMLPIGSSAPLRVGKDRHWHLLALFVIHPRDLMSVNGLQQVLARCHESSTGSHPVPRILQVQTDLSSRLHERTVMPVMQVQIDIEEGVFAGQGEMYLFSRVLSTLFTLQRDALTFTEVTVRGLPSETSYEFRS